MPISPTITDIKDNIIQDIEARINQNVRLLPKAFINVLAKVLAGIFIQLYKYDGFIFLQLFVSTASFNETTIFGKTIRPLVEWGTLFGAGEPTAAKQATLEISVDVEILSSTLPSGTQFLSSVNNIIYITTQDYTLSSTPFTIEVTATEGGELGNLEAGDELTTVNPISQISRAATVSSVVTVGIDEEAEEDYRARVLEIKQAPPRGGAYSDYKIWALEVGGIINAYPYAGNPGQVLVYCEGDPDIYADGIVPPATLLEVADSIDQIDRRPVTAIIDPVGDGSYTNIKSITRTVFDVQIAGLDVQNTAEVKTSIEEALTSYFLEREPFIDGLTPSPRKDKLTQSNIIAIVDDIVFANNGTFTSATLLTSGVSQVEYILSAGEKTKIGAITYV